MLPKLYTKAKVHIVPTFKFELRPIPRIFGIKVQNETPLVEIRRNLCKKGNLAF